MKKTVESLAALLELKQDVVKESIEKDELGGLIKNWEDSKKIFTEDELKNLLGNAEKDAVLAISKPDKDGRYPQDIYSPIKGTVLEMEEKWFKDKFPEFKEFENLPYRERIEQTISKIKSNTNKGDDKSKERITELETALTEQIGKNEELKVENQGKFDTHLIEVEKTKAVNSLLIDAEGEKLSIQKELVTAMFEKNFNFSVVEEKVIVSKNGSVIKDKLLNPMKVVDVLEQHAPAWTTLKSVSNGGRGEADDTSGSTNMGLKIRTIAEFNAHLKEKGIAPNTPEAYKVQQEIRKTNPEFNK